ncbi:hypothetical protein GGS23DRAFT_120442 [Durotheca rogersii]|uniref:uncharacterized protein n=1 Tax=Durotheca rogersii TaxID=419775 RepID=UPI00221E8F39|nr:uncharacterized protein GGS23DRAFT_120442 [Durotheca rogersii]KAI5861952.1 hypothetical protein GGS23DRAFT_120442 [Durotheca rogersii]
MTLNQPGPRPGAGWHGRFFGGARSSWFFLGITGAEPINPSRKSGKDTAVYKIARPGFVARSWTNPALCGGETEKDAMRVAGSVEPDQSTITSSRLASSSCRVCCVVNHRPFAGETEVCCFPDVLPSHAVRVTSSIKPQPRRGRGHHTAQP